MLGKKKYSLLWDLGESSVLAMRSWLRFTVRVTRMVKGLGKWCDSKSSFSNWWRGRVKVKQLASADPSPCTLQELSVIMSLIIRFFKYHSPCSAWFHNESRFCFYFHQIFHSLEMQTTSRLSLSLFWTVVVFVLNYFILVLLLSTCTFFFFTIFY